MNRYGNKVGCFTPEETAEHIKTFNKKTTLKWVDNSWHNDECDSLHHEISCTDKEHKYVEIFLPNKDGGVCNGYCVVENGGWHSLYTEDINKVIKYINENY